jgi:hypothetical protein
MGEGRIGTDFQDSVGRPEQNWSLERRFRPMIVSANAGFVILDATPGFGGHVKDDVCPNPLEEHFLKQVQLP